MVKSSKELDRVFQALADPTRRSMLLALREGDRSVAELAEPFAMSLPGASKHVQVLEQAKLLTRQKQGRSRICSINREAFEQAENWLNTFVDFWNTKFDKLVEELNKQKVEDDE